MELHFSQEDPNPSFNFYNNSCNSSLDQFDYVLDEMLSDCQCEYDSLGGAGAALFTYSSSPVASSSTLDEVSRDDPDALLDVGLLFDEGGTSATKPNYMNVMRDHADGKAKGGDDAKKPHRVAFKTKSKLDVLNDGYRWRKYGKKPIKNNPHLRNYYKCTSEGCQVKKRVERWIEDPSYVITQYDGLHTHP